MSKITIYKEPGFEILFEFAGNKIALLHCNVDKITHSKLRKWLAVFENTKQAFVYLGIEKLIAITPNPKFAEIFLGHYVKDYDEQYKVYLWGLELIAAALTVVSTVASMDAQADARSASRRAQGEQNAQNAMKRAQERRQQIREERVRRSRMLQQSSNSGTIGSSGEIGALSSLATQLSSNLGFNQALFESGQRISQNMQTAANEQGKAATWNDIGRLSSSIFSMAPSSNKAPSLSSEFDKTFPFS